MTKAELDDVLLTLHNAADHIRRTHMNCSPERLRRDWTISAADIVAVAILEQAARDVLSPTRKESAI